MPDGWGYRRELLERPAALTDAMLDEAAPIIRAFAESQEIDTDPAAILLFQVFAHGLGQKSEN
jgi:hypothetical protein